MKKRRNATYIAKILECTKKGDFKRAKALSRVLISEGSYIKGFGVFMLSHLGNENLAEDILSNKRLSKIFLKYF